MAASPFAMTATALFATVATCQGRRRVFRHGITATALFAAVATALPVQTPHELAPHSFCAANMAAAVDNRA